MKYVPGGQIDNMSSVVPVYGLVLNRRRVITRNIDNPYLSNQMASLGLNSLFRRLYCFQPIYMSHKSMSVVPKAGIKGRDK